MGGGVYTSLAANCLFKNHKAGSMAGFMVGSCDCSLAGGVAEAVGIAVHTLSSNRSGRVSELIGMKIY